jgi:hypothetical protein
MLDRSNALCDIRRREDALLEQDVGKSDDPPRISLRTWPAVAAWESLETRSSISR